jgi:hypothetical protein
MKRVLQGVSKRRLRAPGDVIQLRHVLVVHETTADVPDTYSIIDTKTWTLSRSKNMLSIRAPLAVGAVGSLNGANFGIVLFKIVYIHMASQISKAGHKNETTVRREKNSVARSKIEAMLSDSTCVKDGSLCGHVPICYTKLFRVRVPCDVVNRTLLV